MGGTFEQFVRDRSGKCPSALPIGNLEQSRGGEIIENRFVFLIKVFPSLNVTNIVPLSTSLTFKNWCEIVPSNDQTTLPTCEVTLYNEETVTPHRCLHEKSSEEESIGSRGQICQKQQLADSNKCLSINQFRQRATTFCIDRDEILGSSFRPSTSCGLARFTAIEFDCCSTKEDDPIRELVILPKMQKGSPFRLDRRRNFVSLEPDWYTNDRRAETDKELFAGENVTAVILRRRHEFLTFQTTKIFKTNENSSWR